MPAVTFSHTGTTVPDLDKAVEFYSEAFDLYVIMGPKDLKPGESAIGQLCDDAFDERRDRRPATLLVVKLRCTAQERRYRRAAKGRYAPSGQGTSHLRRKLVRKVRGFGPADLRQPFPEQMVRAAR